MLLLDAERPGLALGNCALFLGAHERRPGLLFLALMYGKALGQISFEAAIGVDAGGHLAMLAKPLRGAFERTLGGNAFVVPIFHYIDGAGDDEVTYRRKTEAYERCDLVPNSQASKPSTCQQLLWGRN
jgi:hypothetical protein